MFSFWKLIFCIRNSVIFQYVSLRQAITSCPIYLLALFVSAADRRRLFLPLIAVLLLLAAAAAAAAATSPAVDDGDIVLFRIVPCDCWGDNKAADVPVSCVTLIVFCWSCCVEATRKNK